MRRAYQKGYVFQKGRKRCDAWQPEEPAFVQFWRDVPGQDQPTKEAVHLGLCRTRTIAEPPGLLVANEEKIKLRCGATTI